MNVWLFVARFIAITAVIMTTKPALSSKLVASAGCVALLALGFCEGRFM
jgi:hypothetical protein